MAQQLNRELSRTTDERGASLPPFTLRQLAYLVAATDAGTLAAAAEELHVSASAMSDAITELEAVLGERLSIRRRAHGLTLTPVGQQVVDHARRVLTEADELRRSVGAGDGLTGPIVMGCYPTLAPTILPPLLQDFARLHPRVELSIREATQDQLASDLASGRIDVAFVYDVHVPSDTDRSKLYELHAYVLLPAAHPLGEREHVRLEDLIHEDLILLDATPSSEHTLSVFAARGLRPTIRHRTASFEVVRTLVARGLGYGILVSRTANSASYEGLPLITRPITPQVQPVAVEMIWAENRPLPMRTQALIHFAQTADWPE